MSSVSIGFDLRDLLDNGPTNPDKNLNVLQDLRLSFRLVLTVKLFGFVDGTFNKPALTAPSDSYPPLTGHGTLPLESEDALSPSRSNHAPRSW